MRDPQETVTRHFGESLFTAQQLFGSEPHRATLPELTGSNDSPQSTRRTLSATPHVLDLGSGAGFPGLPIKIWAPTIRLTLVESNQKKATFLREVVRALGLADVAVFNAPAEEFTDAADVVTMRAVERFESILPIAARLVRPGGRIALMIGEKQFSSAKRILNDVEWGNLRSIPQSESRVVVIGHS